MFKFTAFRGDGASDTYSENIKMKEEIYYLINLKRAQGNAQLAYPESLKGIVFQVIHAFSELYGDFLVSPPEEISRREFDSLDARVKIEPEQRGKENAP